MKTPPTKAALDKKFKCAATVTIHGAGSMTPAGRREIAAWLRSHAQFITKEGKNYSKRFTGRYLHP